MYRIDSPGSVAGAWVDRDPVAGIAGTQIVQEYQNEVQEELIAILTAAGVAVAKGTRTQIRDAIKRMYGGFVTTVVFADSPKALTLANTGLVLVDASGGNVVVNLPAAAVLPGARFTFARTDSSANSVTVNRAGADVFDNGLTSFKLGGLGDTREIKSDGVSTWRSGYVPALPANKAVNGGCDIDQANEGALVTQATGGSAYGPDFWFLRNATGVNATIQRAAAIANTPSVKYEVQVKSAGAGGATSPELYHIFDEVQSEELYNRAVSVGSLVRGIGNVDIVGVQLVYKTTAAKFDSTNVIGGEVLVAVGAGAYSFAAILAQALGTVISPGVGIYGVRFRATHVSSGAIADNGNGFAVTQFQATLGTVVNGLWQRSGSFAQELVACKRSYEKTYSQGQAPGSLGNTGGELFWEMPSAGDGTFNVRFEVEKRSVPTRTHYSESTGTSGHLRNFTTAADINVGQDANGGCTGYTISPAPTPTAGHLLGAHATWDSRI